jgi:hypothetical protein
VNRVERDLWRVIFRQWRTPRTLWSNLRFMVGMRVGGFKTASR